MTSLLASRRKALQWTFLVSTLFAFVLWLQTFGGPELDSTGSHLQVSDRGTIPKTLASKHTLRPDGLLQVDMDGRHPLWELMESAERQWEEMNARQSKTLKQAVLEYTKRNGYAPPAGFDLWWEYTQRHNIKLVDEFDQINYDITPYLALSPESFRKRVEPISDPNYSYHINITDGHVNIYGPDWFGRTQRRLASMVMGFSRALPNITIHANDQLRGDVWIGNDLRQAAREKVQVGQHFTEEEIQHFEKVDRNSHRDLKNVCLPEDPIFNLTAPSETPTFIKSHLTYLSPCANPHIHRTPTLLFTPNAKELNLSPRFVFAKHRPGSGLLLPTNTWNFRDTLLAPSHTWSERRGPGAQKLFWRGPVTGWNWFKGIAGSGSITWRDGMRAKLALMFSEKISPGPIDVLIEGENGLITKQYDRAWLNERWMDIGLVGKPVQCNVEDGTCDDMGNALMWKDPYPEHKEIRKKFSVDLDSNDWSMDFQHKLSWGHVVFKATTFPEWNTQWLIPYYHYIPIQSDFSDVYNIMAFFLGDPERGTGNHEEQAAQISYHASEFARKYWRWEDMQAYLFRLMLEYVRLASDDREAASFQL